MFHEKGIATVALVIVLMAVIIGGFVGLKAITARHAEPTPPLLTEPLPSLSPSPTDSATPSATPINTVKPVAVAKPSPIPVVVKLIDCIGPDGKHTQLSQTACDDFLKAWTSPTPGGSAVPNNNSSTGCNSYDLSAAIGDISVILKAQTGQSLTGGAIITISDKYTGCTGVDPGWPYSQLISDTSSQTEMNFGSMRPGPRTIVTQYHGHTYTNDVQINSGGNSLTVTVDQ